MNADADQGLFGDRALKLRHGSRLAVVDPNRCGQSTLVKGRSADEMAGTGRVTRQDGASFADADPLVHTRDLDDRRRLRSTKHHLPVGSRARACFLSLDCCTFRRATSHSRSASSVTGRRRPIPLVQCLLSVASMLLLDEPANHLDRMAIGLMEPALVNCSDEVVISRGQFSLDKVATGLPTFDGRHDTSLVVGNLLWGGKHGAVGPPRLSRHVYMTPNKSRRPRPCLWSARVLAG